MIAWKKVVCCRGIIIGFQFRNESSSARSMKTRCCAEAYLAYGAQAPPLFDVEIAEKGHLWMETNSHPLRIAHNYISV